jgi:hypothetical protein
MDVALICVWHLAGMEKEIGTHSEAESLPRTLLSPLYLCMLAGVVIAGALFVSILFV